MAVMLVNPGTFTGVPLAPPVQTVPSDLSASEKLFPRATRGTLANPVTCTAVRMESPQRHTLPSDLTASAPWARAPEPTAITLAKPATCTGALRVTVVPSPSAPAVFKPHAQTVPSLLRASEKALP